MFERFFAGMMCQPCLLRYAKSNMLISSIASSRGNLDLLGRLIKRRNSSRLLQGNFCPFQTLSFPERCQVAMVVSDAELSGWFSVAHQSIQIDGLVGSQFYLVTGIVQPGEPILVP